MVNTTATASASVVKEARYVLTDIASNNNKYWNIRLFGDGTCETHWGRIGENGQRKVLPSFSETAFASKCREKQSKGYRPQKTLADTAGSGTLAGEHLVRIAAAQIETDCLETTALVAHLARINVHRILEATTLAYDAARGTFSTPLGIVTADALAEARALLVRLSAMTLARCWQAPEFAAALSEYLMLVPRNIGRGRPDPEALLPDTEALQRERALLDALDASLHLALQPTDTAPIAPPALFEARLVRVEDPAVIARIRRKYRETQQAMHACAHLDVQRVFTVEIGSMRRAFDARGRRVGAIQELWHGTRASNLLSILRAGFVIPPASAGHCTGRMFGNGVYFSDQSTKSLNYAYGTWQGGADDTSYMFLCDVALGRSHTPRGWSATATLPRPGTDSTFARAGRSGVANNEMIVYDTAQILPTFLVEFGKA